MYRFPVTAFGTTKVLHFSPDSKVFPHGVTLNNVNAEIQLIRKEIQLIQSRISCICGATTAVSFPYQLYNFQSLADLTDDADILVNKNHKNTLGCLSLLQSSCAKCYAIVFKNEFLRQAIALIT